MSQNRPPLELILCRPNAKCPRYGSSGSAGVDLHACLTQPVDLPPGATHLIPSGVRVYIRDRSLAGFVLPRSGLGHKGGLVLGNLVGLIDSDYQGEIFISAWNRNHEQWVTIEPEQRIAQLVIVQIVQPDLMAVTEFTDETERGDGGFGST